MNVALIGANGFIGTRLVERLHLGERHAVTAIVRRPSSLALPCRFDLPVRIANALEAASLAPAVAGCDAIVHAAIGDPAQIRAMPAALCQAAARTGIRRVIYLSSASVHGQAPAPGTDEASPLHTRHALEYNNAKVSAERRFFAECRRHGLEGFALRPGVVYGPRSRWIADLGRELLQGQAWLYRDGAGICNGIYVDNLVEAILLCLSVPAAAAGAYLIGDAERVTWADFYGLAANHVGVSLASVARLETLPDFPRSSRDRLLHLAASKPAQAVLPMIPASLKRISKGALGALQPSPRPNAWRPPSPPRPAITEEMARLQQCSWKLPHRLAEERLGYRPVVDFPEAMRRSYAWWHFARGGVPAPASSR